jgi:hypothetical protein
MEKLPHYYTPWIVSFKKTETNMCEMLPPETKQSRGKQLPHLDLRGKGGVFLGEISSSKCYSKEDYKEEEEERHSYKVGTWN